MPNRTLAPVKFEYPASLSLPLPEESISINGLRLHTYHYKELDTVKIELIFPVGSFDDDIPGKTLLTSKCLLSGSARFSAEETNEKIASFGAFVDVASSFDYTSLTIYALNEQVAKLLPIIGDIVNNPSFPDKEVELQKTILASNLETQFKKTQVLSSRELRRQLFGISGYGKSTTPEDLKELTAKDISDWYKSKFTSLEIIATGNTDANLIKQVLDQFNALSSIQKPKMESLGLDNNNFSTQVEVSDSVQTSIRIGKKIIGKKHEDYTSLIVVNHILGGFFGSRLMSKLREKEGLTYGVYSSLNNLYNENYMAIGCDVKSSHKNLAIDLILNQIKRLSEENISISELEIAKKHMVGSLQSSLSSTESISNKFKSLHLYGIDVNYYNRLFNKIKSISAEEVISISQNYLSDNSFTIVTAG